MKNKVLFALIVLLALGAGSLLLIQSEQKASREQDLHAALFGPASPPPVAAHSHARVPAYQAASEVDNLAPTLPAAQFVGKTREAYSVAKKIPETLAQLPCYCECDRGFGHKSLHTCFVDDHASHCAICVDEALLAYKLQTEERMTPEQVREKIIAQYSAAHTTH